MEKTNVFHNPERTYHQRTELELSAFTEHYMAISSGAEGFGRHCQQGRSEKGVGGVRSGISFRRADQCHVGVNFFFILPHFSHDVGNDEKAMDSR